jgi:hypothetical protein
LIRVNKLFIIDNSLNFRIISVISRKRLDADKNLAKNLEEKSRLEIENAHKREDVLDIFDYFTTFFKLYFYFIKIKIDN